VITTAKRQRFKERVFQMFFIIGTRYGVHLRTTMFKGYSS
jgi:hypothetical protein